jgi:hypothetical protein
MGTSMKKNILSIILLLSIISLFSPDFMRAQDKQKSGQTGMKFIGISTDAKVSGMGNAVTSLFGSSSTMLYNPAGIANLGTNVDVAFGQTQWIASISYLYGTIAFNPFNADYGIFGLSVVAVDYGDLIGTIRTDTEQGFTEVGNFSPTAMVVGLSYGKMLSEKFAIGANIKYAYQSLGTGVVSYAANGSYNKEDFSTDVFAFDFGLIYKTGFKSLNIGMSITNFSQEIKFIEVGFQLPLLFKLGASMDVFDFFNMSKETHSLIVSVDATHPRDYPEQILLGAEYTFMQSFSLRGGYETPSDIGGLSVGAGVNVNLSGIDLGVDYSWSEAGVFDNIHRFAVKFAF